MLAVCGAAVCALHRERIGALSLLDYPELQHGQVMALGEREEAILRTMLPVHRVADTSPSVAETPAKACAKGARGRREETRDPLIEDI